jgi:hypothetical protein
MADFSRRITGAAAVTSVMKSLGLTPPPSVVGSADETANQMWELATDVGQQLCSVHDWQWLSRDHTITTSPGTTLYDLPEAFDGYIEDAQWNYTSRLPMLGALSTVEWQMVKARQLAGTTFALMFQVTNDKLELYESPSTAQTLVLPYRSRGWVVSATGTLKDNLSQNDDEVMFDPQLFKTALKLAWFSAKEFDTTKLEMAVARLISSAKSKDTPGRTLNIGCGSAYPYLGYLNIPDGGYGA